VLWVLLDVALGVASVLLLAVLCLRLWRRVKGLTRALGTASRAVAEAQDSVQGGARGSSRH
jgi:HAMP domain-containing protein